MSQLKILCFALLTGISCYSYAQVPLPVDTLKVDTVHMNQTKLQQQEANMTRQYDVSDLIKDVFHPGRERKPVNKKSPIIIIPNIASNPSIGSQIGIKAVAGKKLGKDPNTLMSVAATSASITTKGIIYFYINHNIYTDSNKWNFQGSLVAAKTVTPDYGLGIGHASNGTAEDKALANPERKGRALYAQYYNLREKVYKEVGKNLFVGVGVSFDIRRMIDERDTTNMTPYDIYNKRHGFARDHYLANGLLFNVQYTTRDNQNRAYSGIYADAGVRVNQSWMGSTKNAVQFTHDLRKYISLSNRHPEHVIALWNWGAYLVNGHIPYLELPGTGKDAGFRSGRGYTVGYFKGTQYNYSEAEYRFPLLRNGFISGVAFLHVQTTNDESGTKIGQIWQPGGGGGLRVLFNKVTRTNLCLDYAWGKYGARGFFLGLNEAF